MSPHNDSLDKTTSSRHCKMVGHYKLIAYGETYLEVECAVEHTVYTAHSNTRAPAEDETTIHWPVTQAHLTLLKTVGTPSTYFYAVRVPYSLSTCPVWAVSQAKNWTCIIPRESGPHAVHSWISSPELSVHKSLPSFYHDEHNQCHSPSFHSGPSGKTGGGSHEGYICEKERGHTGPHAWNSAAGIVNWPVGTDRWTLVDKGCIDGIHNNFFYIFQPSTCNDLVSAYHFVVVTNDYTRAFDCIRLHRHTQACFDDLLPIYNTSFDIIKDVKAALKHPVPDHSNWSDSVDTKTTKEKKEKEKDKKKPYPEDVLSREARHRSLVGGQHYPVPVEWIGHYSITNQEGEYFSIDTRIRRHLFLGRFKTEWGATRAAWRLVDRYNMATSTLRLDYVQPVLPKELQTEEGR